MFIQCTSAQSPFITCLPGRQVGCIFFELTQKLDLVYNWFHILKDDKIEIIAQVIMPNHIHCILYFLQAGFKLDKILSNGKRFMSYEFVNRLEIANEIKTLKSLQDALTEKEKEKSNCIKYSKILLMPMQFFQKSFLFRN